MKYKPKTKPFPHQARATLRAARARNHALFFEPRLGKSKAALDYVGILALKGEVRRVLILAPKIAIDVWEGQITQHYPFTNTVESYDLEWEQRGDTYVNFITSFFLAGREATWRREGGVKGSKAKEIEKWNPDVIIVDESHEYKRPGGRGAQDCWRMVERLRKRRKDGRPYVLLLSGTPNPKGWIDLFAQLRLMDSSILGTNAGDFKDEYVIFHPKLKWKIIKYRKEKKLEKKIRAHSVSVNAEEAGLANVQFFETLKYELPARVKKMYLDMAEEFLVEWEGGVISAKNAGVKRLRLLQLCGGFTTDHQQIHDSALRVLKDYLALLYEQGESVVVYSRFTPEVAATYECASDVGFRAFRVDGSTKDQDRRRGIASLGSIPKSPTAVVFQHQAGSRAIELVGAAETVYYSAPDGWVDYFQTLKRTQGPNQRRPVRYTHLVAPGTVTVSVIRGLQQKEDWHAGLMKNPRRYLFGLV